MSVKINLFVFFLLTSLLSYSQVDFKEIVFSQTGDLKGFQITNDEHDLNMHFLTSDYFSINGKKFVDFVPDYFKGTYNVIVGENAVNNYDEKKAKRNIASSKNIFQISVNPEKKSGSLLVNFSCNSECDATVSQISNTYLPLLSRNAKNISILILTARTDIMFNKGKRFAEMLKYYGINATARMVESNVLKEAWEQYHPSFWSELLTTTKSRTNEFLTIEAKTFLKSVIYYNRLFDGNVPYIGRYYNYDYKGDYPTDFDQMNYDFVIELPGWD